MTKSITSPQPYTTQSPAPLSALLRVGEELNAYLAELHTRAAEIIEHRATVAQYRVATEGGYCPDELPLGAELAAVNEQIAALEAAEV